MFQARCLRLQGVGVSWAVGDRVSAKVGDELCAGKISRDHGDGTFTVERLDGQETVEPLFACHLQPASVRGTLG